jgi:hypothetical protein
MEQLKELSEAEAVELLEGCGMKKIQIRTVMKAVAPPAPAAPVSPVPPPAPAPAVAPAPAPAPAPFTAPKPVPVSFKESPTCVATLQGHSSYVHSVAFHPSATLMATGSDDKSTKLWR